MGHSMGQRISRKTPLNFYPLNIKEKFRNHFDFGTFMCLGNTLDARFWCCMTSLNLKTFTGFDKICTHGLTNCSVTSKSIFL